MGLLGLPEPIFGLIFEHLSSDQRSAHSFYNSCRAIRDAPSVNQRIHCYKLSISPSQARRELDFSGWPRRAGVKEVKVDLDEQHDGGEVVHPPVFTCAAEQRCKGVETLELNVSNALSGNRRWLGWGGGALCQARPGPSRTRSRPHAEQQPAHTLLLPRASASMPSTVAWQPTASFASSLP